MLATQHNTTFVVHNIINQPLVNTYGNVLFTCMYKLNVRTCTYVRRFFFGKNRVMQCALGLTEAEEYKDGLHLLAKVNSHELYSLVYVEVER